MGQVRVSHNLKREKFKWLWAKYVIGVNDQKHCTNSLRGRYSRVLSKHNTALNSTPTLTMDEQPSGSYGFIYICGVISKGYPRTNYPHNLHAVIKPDLGSSDELQFEDWRLRVMNGVFQPIPSEHDLPQVYRSLAPEFTTCRIFRWAVCSALNQYREGR
jgi:hypothetical protein